MRKKAAKKEKLIAMTLLFVLCLVGCQKGEQGQDGEPTPTETAEPTVTVTPTVVPSDAERGDGPFVVTPEPTATPTVTATSEPTKEPTQAELSEPTAVPTTTVPTVAPEQPFTMVSPVPESAVADIVGTMTVEDYPVVDGSTATLPLSEAVFMAATGESAEVAAQTIVHTKTTNSYTRLYNKEVDLLIVYEPAESIVERMKTEPLCIKPIGLDALVFMANQANPVESLTMEQLVSIYSGEINNWSEVGGPDKNLLAFQRPIGSGSQTLMQKLVMRDVEMVTGDNVFRYSTMSDILEGMLSYNGEDNTLGYSVFYYANNMYFEKDLKFMAVDGVFPSTQTIYDGSYKLDNPFYAVIRTDEPEDSNARKIFDWLTGEDGQQLILDLGYVPVQMPEGADISDVKVEQTETVELLTKEPLEQGQYFILVNPQNMVSDYYYGDMTVYNSSWEEVASFYNVTLNHWVQGIYTNRYLPIGQIRQNAEGEQKVLYGVFDLENGEYSVSPAYTDMEMLDVNRGYYAVPQQEGEWMDYMVINGNNDVLLPQVAMEDWLTISKFGNGYLEMSYDYENWENGCTYRYYDENLQLKKVYCQKDSALPPEEEWLEGVEYYTLDDGVCLVDENGEILINWASFLSKYGDGEDMECELPFYTVTHGDGADCFGILYQNKIYLVDRNLELIRMIDNTAIVNSYSRADFYRDFCYYYDEAEGGWIYRTYEGSPVRMWDGDVADEIIFNWNSDDYLLYRREGKRLYVEEYTDVGEPEFYEYSLRTDDMKVDVSYDGNSYIRVMEHTGEYVQNEFSYYGTEIREMTLYYKDTPMCATNGLQEYIYQLDDGYELWVVFKGDSMEAESESIFDEMTYSYACNDFVLYKDGRVLYEIDSAYLLSQGNNAIFFLKGNYLYAVGFDGTPYVKALRTFMSMD